MVRLRICVFNRVLNCARSSSPLCCLLALLIVAAASVASHAQSGETASAQLVAASPQSVHDVYDKQEILRRMTALEDLARNAKSLHLSQQDLIKVYKNLALLYDLSGMIPHAVAATQQAIALMKDGPQDQLAEEYNILSTMHGLAGDLRQAEKDEKDALAVREKIGDPLGTALTWTDIAGLYCEEHHYEKALEYAQKSYDVLANHTDMKPTNHVAVLQTMAFALCGVHQCSKGVPIMKAALEESRSAFGPDSLSAAAQGFALGYVYWKNGDNTEAAEWMRESLVRIKSYLGWGAPLYVNSIKQYARFLHETGERDEARNTEAEIHIIESVVDARSLTTRNTGFLSPGNR